MAFGLTDSGCQRAIADQERLDRFADIDIDLRTSLYALRIQRIRQLELMSAYADVTEMPEQAPEPEDDAANAYLRPSTGKPGRCIVPYQHHQRADELGTGPDHAQSQQAPEPRRNRHSTRHPASRTAVSVTGSGCLWPAIGNAQIGFYISGIP